MPTACAKSFGRNRTARPKMKGANLQKKIKNTIFFHFARRMPAFLAWNIEKRQYNNTKHSFLPNYRKIVARVAGIAGYE